MNEVWPAAIAAFLLLFARWQGKGRDQPEGACSRRSHALAVFAALAFVTSVLYLPGSSVPWRVGWAWTSAAVVLVGAVFQPPWYMRMMQSPSLVAVTRALAIAVLSLCALVLGFFVLMAESGGKDSRPDVLLPLVLSICVLVFGVRRETARRGVVSALMTTAAFVGISPLPLSYLLASRRWPLLFAIPWCVGLALSACASWLSRAPDPAPRSGTRRRPSTIL